MADSDWLRSRARSYVDVPPKSCPIASSLGQEKKRLLTVRPSAHRAASASRIAGEQVSPQPDGLDHRLRPTRFVQLAPQAADARVDGTVEPVVVDPPHHAQDLVARDDAALPRGEQPQDVEVARGELEGPAGDGRAAAPGIDLQPACGELRFLGRARRRIASILASSTRGSTGFTT